MQNGADTSEDSLVDFFQKLAHPFHMIGQYCSLVFMQKNENLCLHKSLHMDIYTALFIIAKTWKQLMSFNRWRSKLWNIQTMVQQ